jgi:hypothetical protein
MTAILQTIGDGSTRSQPCLSTIEHCYLVPKSKGVSNKTVLRKYLPHSVGMRMGDLTPKQLLSVPCPTCGVAAGARCLLHSGAPRMEPHVDRKLSAADAIERKRSRREDGIDERLHVRNGVGA